MAQSGIGALYSRKKDHDAQADVDEFIRSRTSSSARSEGSSAHGPVRTPHTPNGHGPGVHLANMNPAMLLDPKRGVARQAPKPQGMSPSPSANGFGTPAHSKPPTPQFTFSSPSDFVDQDQDRGGAVSQGSMIENMHNVDERSAFPNKRLKRSVSPNPDEHSPRPSSGQRQGGSTGVAQHVRSKHKELVARDGTALSAIDLTDDAIQAVPQDGKATTDIDLTQEETDGEAPFYVVDGQKIYIDPNDDRERKVCYGRIEGTKINVFQVPNPGKPIANKSEWPSMKIRLVSSAARNSLVIKAYDPTNKDFGNLDMKTSYVLKKLLDSPVYRISVEATLDIRSKEPFEAPGQLCSKTIGVSVNLFGPFKYAVDPVGKLLSQRNIWLRTPRTLPHGVDYYNPHCNDFTLAKQAKKAGATALASAVSNMKVRTAEQEQEELGSVFENLQKNEELPQLEPDENIKTDLLEHQKQALGWMVAREDACKYVDGRNTAGSIWKSELEPNGRRIYTNVITGHQQSDLPRDTQGGLLADMMGLGKTLSLLALLSYTKDKSIEFQSAPSITSKDKIQLRNIKTTLLVCPLSVVANWEDQIVQHIKEGAMSYYVYHGQQRNRDLEFLAQFDVVITTYAVVKSEFFPPTRAHKAVDYSPFTRANFFRVVLDEAHSIRTQSTVQFKAALKINAPRRWCLTATPVQNRLEDLGSLILFLKVSPFDTPSAFQQYIIAPFRIRDPDAVKRLRVLVDTITLRRMKDKIDLAPREDVNTILSFTKEEQDIYDFFAREASNRVRAITGSNRRNPRLGGRGYINILRSILCLRQISAHGKELLTDEDMQLIEGRAPSHAIDVEEDALRPALDARQAYDVFDLMNQTNSAFCSKCNVPVGQRAPNLNDDDDEHQVLGIMLPCFQVVCNECAKEVKRCVDETRAKGEDRTQCPFCSEAWRISLFEITASGILQHEQLKEDLRNEPKKAKTLSRYEGPHTKTVKLIDCLMNSKYESEVLMRSGQAPIKSVVFSAWTTHLDLISLALEQNGLEHNKLVGSMSRKQRKQALDEFRDSAEVNVMLISIGTGGVGLNLTAASRVYLMDIGFNPMAEQQAVDRVHRLGQRRPVTFTRFMMSGSIEEKIFELQKKKMDLADLSLQKGKLDKTEAARKRLEELKDLFR